MLCFFKKQSLDSFLAFVCVSRFHCRVGALAPLMLSTCAHQTAFWLFACERDVLQEIWVCKALFKPSGLGTSAFVLMHLLFLRVNGWHSVFVGLPAKLWSGNWVCFKVEGFTQCFNCTRANSINTHSSIKLFCTVSTYAESICIAFTKFASLVFKKKLEKLRPPSCMLLNHKAGVHFSKWSHCCSRQNGPVLLCTLYPCVENVAFIITPSSVHLPDDLTELMLWRICWLALFPCLMC